MVGLIAGIDEAGRGPVFGPMVMAIAAVEPEREIELKRTGVADSKLLSPEKRESLAAMLEDSIPFEAIELAPAVIDVSVDLAGDSLNKLEARTTAVLIHRLASRVEIAKVIIDSPTRNEAAYGAEVRALLDKLDKTGVTKHIELVAEIKADANHPVVGAASIIAKTRRDAAMRALEVQHGPLGSGYPSDPSTQAYLGAHWREAHDFFRKSWESYKRLTRAGEQSSLGDFESHAPDHAATIAAFEVLKDHGFSFHPPTNPYEVVRAKKDGITVIRYTTGKTVVQGADADRLSTVRLLATLGLATQVSETKPRGRPKKS